jgi:hypothetical protein
MIPARWLNSAWMLASAGEARAFRRATCEVSHTQAAVLGETLRTNRDTEFGRAHDFDRIDGPRGFQRRVPLTAYDDYADSINRIAAGEVGVLTAERVELLEPTSGSTGGEKLIPYTRTLRRQFQRAVAAWVHDLFRGRPAVRAGRAYWSVSPAFGPPRRTVGGLPIGFDDDAAYLGRFERWTVRRVLAVPADVARLPDLESFRYRTLLHLLAAANLTLISVWNPTFLTALLAPLRDWHERLCADLVRHDSRRAAELAELFQAGRPLAETLRHIWPRLALLSCWTDAAAARCVGELRELFPTVEVQPKGLLATEGCVSFPLLDRPAPALAVRSHFFEFVESDRAATSGLRLDARLAHELDRGGRYRVVITTGGGLYRYCLNDEVEVVGFENECPLLRFLGKADRVSDLVGEKLSEPHVRSVLDRGFATHSLAPAFALLVPVAGRPARYRLYVQGRPTDFDEALLAAALESGLRENPHYAYAIGLGQLAPAEVHLLDPIGEPASQVYLRCQIRRGIRPGNIKPAVLDAWPGWPEEFASIDRIRSERRRTPAGSP